MGSQGELCDGRHPRRASGFFDNESRQEQLGTVCPQRTSLSRLCRSLRRFPRALLVGGWIPFGPARLNVISGACLHSGFLCVSTGLSFFAVMGTPGPGCDGNARPRRDHGTQGTYPERRGGRGPLRSPMCFGCVCNAQTGQSAQTGVGGSCFHPRSAMQGGEVLSSNHGAPFPRSRACRQHASSRPSSLQEARTHCKFE